MLFIVLKHVAILFPLILYYLCLNHNTIIYFGTGVILIVTILCSNNSFVIWFIISFSLIITASVTSINIHDNTDTLNYSK